MYSTKVKITNPYIKWALCVITLLFLLLPWINSGANRTDHAKIIVSYAGVADIDAPCVSQPVPPIATAQDAACFAAHRDRLAQLLRESQQQSGYSGWEFIVRRTESGTGWDIHVRSQGAIIPSYTCFLSLQADGSLREHTPCSYNK